MNEINNIRGKTAVVGLAEAGCGVTPGWTAMELMATAVHDALDDAGINLSKLMDYLQQLLFIQWRQCHYLNT